MCFDLRPNCASAAERYQWRAAITVTEQMQADRHGGVGSLQIRAEVRRHRDDGRGGPPVRGVATWCTTSTWRARGRTDIASAACISTRRSSRLYRQSTTGIKNRYKLRIRFYDEAADSPAFLEIKKRTTETVHKLRAVVAKPAAERLLARRADRARRTCSRMATLASALDGVLRLPRTLACRGRRRL